MSLEYKPHTHSISLNTARFPPCHAAEWRIWYDTSWSPSCTSWTYIPFHLVLTYTSCPDLFMNSSPCYCERVWVWKINYVYFLLVWLCWMDPEEAIYRCPFLMFSLMLAETHPWLPRGLCVGIKQTLVMQIVWTCLTGHRLCRLQWLDPSACW